MIAIEVSRGVVWAGKGNGEQIFELRGSVRHGFARTPFARSQRPVEAERRKGGRKIWGTPKRGKKKAEVYHGN